MNSHSLKLLLPLAFGRTVLAANPPSLPLQDTFQKVSESVQDRLGDVVGSSTIAGHITPILSKLILTKGQREAIWEGITHVTSISDLLLLTLLGFALVPTFQVPYERIIQPRQHAQSLKRQRGFRSDDYRKSIVFHITNTISQIARLAFVVYAFDMVKIFFMGAGFAIPHGERLTHAFCYILYTIWATHRLSRFKKFVLRQSVPSWSGRIQVLNRLGNALLVGIATLIVLDILSFEMGLALQGVVALGSVGTLVVSLAAKDTVANILNGLILSASDRIYEGDSIRLHKTGFQGNVQKLGWLETILRGNDETMVTIPNADLLSLRVCNLSRIHQCQVEQVLQFQYSDVDKLPQLLEDIKKEIRTTCPAVITDGSRPFRCYWTGFQKDHLEVTLDVHFRIRPVGDAYYENRMRVLQAVNKAVRQNGMTFKAG